MGSATQSVPPDPAAPRSEQALVFTDVVGSTALKQVLGDHEGTQRILRHHEEARRVLSELQLGEEISTSGDGMFLSFDSAAMALRFALLLQRRMRALWCDEPPGRRVRDRIGIHVGQVEVARHPDGTKDLLGLEVDRANRVMSIGGADQVLLSQSAFDRSRQAWSNALAEGLDELSWISHGMQHLANLDQPQELFEVGEIGLASLKPPATTRSSDSTNIAGWRAAVGEIVPGTDWRLERRLGGGTAEEVWRAADRRTSNKCILRFCFEAGRLKRLRERREFLESLVALAGEHPHLARMTACALETPPYYLVYEFVPGWPLADWLETRGDSATSETKLELVAQAADALEGANRAGIIHGDLKPGALIVTEGQSGAWEIKLTRLGLGAISADETLAAVRMLWDSNPTGAMPVGPRFDGQVYVAPELLQGENPSPRSDLYSLGVIMYQLLVGEFMRPVTADWASHISDAALREDLSRCLSASPKERLATVGELAVRLRTLDERRRRVSERERRAFFKGVLRTAGVALVLVGVLGWQTYIADRAKDEAEAAANAREVESRKARESERKAHHRQVGLQVALGEATRARGDVLGSALFHAEALRLASEPMVDRPGSFGDQPIHRIRVATQLQLAPALVQAWWFPDAVTTAIFRPDADQVLVANPEGTLQLLDLGDGKVVQTFSHGSEVNAVVFLDRGRILVTAGADWILRWWDVDSGREIGRRSFHGPAQHLDVSSDGRWMAAVAGPLDRPQIHLFDGPNRNSAVPAVGHSGRVTALAFSPDSRELAVAGEDGIVSRWTLPDFSPLPSLEHPTNNYDDRLIIQVQYSPDGRKLLTASRDHSAGLWDRATGQREGYFWHLTWLSSASFSSDSSRILTTSFDGNACVWSAVPNPATLSPTRPGPSGSRGFLHKLPHGHTVLNGAFSADESRIVTACFDHGAWLWDGESGTLIARLKHAGYVHRIRIHPDNRRVLTAARDGSVKLWDLGGMVGDPPVRVRRTSEDGPPVIRTADGKRFLATPTDNQFQLWDSVSWQSAGPAWPAPPETRIIALDPAGEYVLLETEGQLRIHSAKDGSVKNEAISSSRLGHVAAAFFLSHPSELLVVNRGTDSGFYWFALDGTSAARSSRVVLGPEAGVFLSNDGTVILTSDAAPDEGTVIVRFHDRHSGKEIREPIKCSGEHVHVALSSRSGFALLSPQDGSFSPFDAHLIDLNGGQRWDLPHDDGVILGQFNPNNNGVVATASEDGTARLWKNPGGRLVRILQHQHQVRSLAFSADGLLVATGSLDNSARVWVSATGEALTPPLLHPRLYLHSVGDLWFTPDGQHLVTAWDPPSSRSPGEVIRWSLEPGKLPPDIVKQFTELLNCQTVEALGAAIPLAAEEIRPRWEALRKEHPELFQVSPERIATWHLSEAQSCAARERWSAAVSHWNEVERRRPLTPVESNERQLAQDRARRSD